MISPRLGENGFRSGSIATQVEYLTAPIDDLLSRTLPLITAQG